MTVILEAILQRAECRAAPKSARIPLGDRLAYSTDEGKT